MLDPEVFFSIKKAKPNISDTEKESKEKNTLLSILPNQNSR
jgi:hypothetical protein